VDVHLPPDSGPAISGWRGRSSHRGEATPRW
jgi:hypothetical protein